MHHHDSCLHDDQGPVRTKNNNFLSGPTNCPANLVLVFLIIATTDPPQDTTDFVTTTATTAAMATATA
jgi:hypothetical protein